MIFFTFFLLSPALPFELGYETSMSLTVQKPNGVEIKYYSNTESSVLYTVGSGLDLATYKAWNEAFEKSLLSIVNQLRTDGDL